MIEKLLEFSHEGIKYVFARDDRFTFVQGRVKDDNNYKFMLGGAFCTKQDEYRVDVGCHVALERFCKNLKLDREQRKRVHDYLDEQLIPEKQIAHTIAEIIKQLVETENLNSLNDILFGKGKSKCQ